MQMFRAATLAGIALGFSLALFEPNRFLFVAICGSVFGLLAGMLVGTLLAVFLAPIVRTVLDARREMRQLDQAHFEDADEPTTPIQPNN